jgi:hypothetical protein
MLPNPLNGRCFLQLVFVNIRFSDPYVFKCQSLVSFAVYQISFTASRIFFRYKVAARWLCLIWMSLDFISQYTGFSSCMLVNNSL